MKIFNVLFILFFISKLIYSFDYKIDLNSFTESNSEGYDFYNNHQINFNREFEDVYYEFGIVYYDKLYKRPKIIKNKVEFSKDNHRLVVGRDNIYIGNSYQFNLIPLNFSSDINKNRFLINGYDLISYSYYWNNNNIKLYGISIEDNTGFVIEQSYNIKNSLLNIYYGSKNYYSGFAIEKKNDIILEWKSDYYVGYWIQVSRYDYYVAGFDYSFSLGENTLYTVYEIYFDNNKDYLNHLFKYNYYYGDYHQFSQGYLHIDNISKNLIINEYKYSLNDYATLGIIYNYYMDENFNKLDYLFSLAINIVF